MTALLSTHDFLSFHALPGSPRSPRSPRSSRRSMTPPPRSISALRPSRSSSSLATTLPVTPTSTAETSENEMEVEPVQEAEKPRSRLVLSAEQKAQFAAHIEDSKQKFVSDTAHLPKSTNMGLSDADAAAALSQNKFNFKSAQGWEDDDVDVDAARRSAIPAKDKTVFHMALPVLYVSSVSNSMLFFQKALGFSPVGKPATHQVVMRRGPVSTAPRTSARNWTAIPPVSQDPGVRVVLRLRPQEWGEMSGDGTGPPQLMLAVSSVDDLYKEVTAKLHALRPKGDEYFPEVWFFKAKVLSKPQNKPWGTREMHMLDPDGNKIVFSHELHR